MSQPKAAASNQMSPKRLHQECSNYFTLNHSRRSLSNAVGALDHSAKYDYYPHDKKSAQWQGEGRYRFSGPFTRMAVKGEVTKSGQCGFRLPGYLEDPK